MAKQFFTDDEQVIRLWDMEQVKDLMSRHSYCLSNDQRRKELNDLWVKLPQNRRTASLALNNGYYVGMDEISNYYVVQNNDLRYEQLKAYCDAHPEIEYNNHNLGIGIMNIHTLNTPVYYISEDGKTARYMGYDAGVYTVGHPDGSAKAYFIYGCVFADLLKENGEWKIWHLVMQHDHSIPAGKDYGDVPVRLGPGDDPYIEEFGEPTIKHTVYDPFLGWEYLYQDMPFPYYSYNDMRSYGPNGELGLKYYERERRGI